MKYIISAAIVILLTGLIFRTGTDAFVTDTGKKEKLVKTDTNRSDVTIKQKWELPAELVEVSGIAYIDGQRFACVQDEKGIIYIYNTSTSVIENEIPFSGPGDFEGISLKGDTAYIVRSDGVIFEVTMTSGKTTEYATFLNAGNNVESLFYQATNNRLLMAGKEPDPAAPSFKNIYAFDLETKNLKEHPVSIINLDHKFLTAPGKSGKKKKNFMPSAIAVHPVSNDLYLLDGPKSRLLVTDNGGEIKQVYNLGHEFYKPEGISFSPAGDLFISNEGKKMPGNILEVDAKSL